MAIPQNEAPVVHSTSPLAGRVFLVLLGLSVALLGVLFVWLMASSYLRAKEMRSWPQVPCVIISSETEERKNDPNSRTEYRQRVSFRYQWNDQTFTADLLGLRGSPWTSKPNLVEIRAAEYHVGMETVCFVNPADPSAAYLKPDSLAPGYSIWFPALFVVGGLGISISALRNRKPHLNPAKKTRPIPPSDDP